MARSTVQEAMAEDDAGEDAAEPVVNLIGATKSKKGLNVGPPRHRLLPDRRQVTNEELAAAPITKHDFHGDWNYTSRPTAPAGA